MGAIGPAHALVSPLPALLPSPHERPSPLPPSFFAGPKPATLPTASPGRPAGAGNPEGQRLLTEAAAALRGSHVEFAHQAHQDLIEVRVGVWVRVYACGGVGGEWRRRLAGCLIGAATRRFPLTPPLICCRALSSILSVVAAPAPAGR